MGKIIASDLREIVSDLDKVGGYPALNISRAIGENLITTAITPRNNNTLNAAG